MNVESGRWNFDGRPIGRDLIDRLESMATSYGRDDNGSYEQRGIAILHCAFHTTAESRHQKQPYTIASGGIMTWDGRLDNRAELIGSLGMSVHGGSSDIEIVVSAYERWDMGCFAKLIGDWALVLWNPNARSLILAKDSIGMRPLFYEVDGHGVTWSSILDPLVLQAGRAFTLCEEYVAGWLSSFPAADLTPYDGIYSVPPSSYVSVHAGSKTIRKYWDFDPGKRVRYQSDAEYEEHFRSAFAESVRRRLRSDSPVLAELSGGMDSSSIVCMADTLIERGLAPGVQLDTVSYFSGSEPNWDERPYFTKVEEKRGKIGCHIEVGLNESLVLPSDGLQFKATPGSGGEINTTAGKQFLSCVAAKGHRVVLSGIGGDEVTGGVPDSGPEIADLLTKAHIVALTRQLGRWSIQKRKPWFYLLFEAVQPFAPIFLKGRVKGACAPNWFHPDFVKRYRDALRGYESRWKLLGPLPSFQENLSTLDMLRRQLSGQALPPQPTYEKRYPYLDRDFLEFLYAIPREQLVRPGQRRSLMRRALVGIVPDELLRRKRKAYVSRLPMVAIATDSRGLLELSHEMVSDAFGFVVQSEVARAIDRICSGCKSPVVPLMRTLAFEQWLRGIQHHGVFRDRVGNTATHTTAEPPSAVSVVQERILS